MGKAKLKRGGRPHTSLGLEMQVLTSVPCNKPGYLPSRYLIEGVVGY